MIAVGGDVLSRGLTIEGLTVSYFYRIVGAADTLLQMARWFGYRPGYETSCESGSAQMSLISLDSSPTFRRSFVPRFARCVNSERHLKTSV